MSFSISLFVCILYGLVFVTVEGQPTTEDANVNFNLIDEVAMLKMKLAELEATIRGKCHKMINTYTLYTAGLLARVCDIR